MEKPSDFDHYKGIMEQNTGQPMQVLKSNYVRTVNAMAEEFQNSDYYKKLRDILTTIDNDYKQREKFDLINFNKTLKIDKKCFNNMLEKCYRIDVVHNDLWDRENQEWLREYQWHDPFNCYELLTDIIRTRITIRYIDGADNVLNGLLQITNECSLEYKYDYFAEIEGYYCIHFDLKYPLTKYNLDETKEEIIASIEIQITTQIKDVINELLHEYYKESRMRRVDPLRNWQWDYKSYEFLPNYLGHISHYIEGMILEARQKIKGK